MPTYAQQMKALMHSLARPCLFHSLDSTFVCVDIILLVTFVRAMVDNNMAVVGCLNRSSPSS